MSNALPLYHSGLLLVKMRRDHAPWRGMASFRGLDAVQHPGLSALDELGRAGLVRRVTPLSQGSELRPTGASMVRAFAASLDDQATNAPDDGANIVELEPETNITDVRRKLGGDSSVEYAELVPVR